MMHCGTRSHHPWWFSANFAQTQGSSTILPLNRFRTRWFIHNKSTEMRCNYLKRLAEKVEETCSIAHYFRLTKPTLPMQDLISSRVYGTIAERDEAEFRALIRSAI